MRKYDINNPDDFRELERLAYSGNTPLKGLPLSAYWYFTQLEFLCRQYHANQIDKQDLQHHRQENLRKYQDLVREEQAAFQCRKERSEDIIAAQKYLLEIEKATTTVAIAEAACQCIERLTGEVGFCNRQMKKIAKRL